MKNILVTGGQGQLAMCIRELSDNYQELNFCFKSSTELDITDSLAVSNFIDCQNFDYCINCAAYTAVDNAEKEKERAFSINAFGVRNLAQACKTNNVTLIHVSTDFVFDGKQITPYKEDDSVNPINVYGASKLNGENFIKQILEKYFIIRTSWVYSEYGNNFVKSMIRLGTTKDEISVVGDQIGSPTYAMDLAEFLIKIINSNSKKYSLYHYSNEGEISWYDFAIEIFRLKNINIKINKIYSKEYKTLAKRPFYSVLDKEKITKEFGVDVIFWKDSIKKQLSN